MNVNDAFQDIANELHKVGVGIAKDPVVTVNQIIEIGNDLDLDAVEELLARLTSYNIFLKSQKGSYEAQLVIKGGELKRLLYLETQNMPKQSPEGVYYRGEEKESLVLSGKLKDLNEEVLRIRAIIARIKDVPYAIDKKIELLKMKYRRLAADEYREKSGSQTTS